MVDQTGQRVPLLTQTELLELFDGALISLFDLMLRFAGKSPDRRRPKSGVFNPESPSRWLVEAGLTAHLYRADIVGSRLRNDEAEWRDGRSGDGPGNAGWADDPVRLEAVTFLDRLIPIPAEQATEPGPWEGGEPEGIPMEAWRSVAEDTSWVPFLHLLEQVRSKQFVVVGLDASNTDHSLTFSAPDLPNRVTPEPSASNPAAVTRRGCGVSVA